VTTKTELLAELRVAYMSAATDQERQGIMEEAEKVKKRLWCEQCDEVTPSEEHFPFCSGECHEAWAAAHYGKAKSVQRRRSVEECQARIQEIIAEKRSQVRAG
jgi:transcriptional regulator NrdR family protein